MLAEASHDEADRNICNKNAGLCANHIALDLMVGLPARTNMRTCCCCRAPQILRGCREFATNWRPPNTIDHDLSHFSVTWLRPHLKEKWATAFSARRLPPLRAPAPVPRACKIAIYRCSTYGRRRVASGRLSLLRGRSHLPTIKTRTIFVRAFGAARRVSRLSPARGRHRDGGQERLIRPGGRRCDLKSFGQRCQSVRVVHLGQPLGELVTQISDATRRS